MNNTNIDEFNKLVDIVEKQKMIIESHNNRILHLENKLNNVSNTVYHLLNGLFNQTEQPNILEYHIGELLDGKKTLNEVDQSKWTSWPTTRQGDSCEKRLDKIEDVIKYKIFKLSQNKID